MQQLEDKSIRRIACRGIQLKLKKGGFRVEKVTSFTERILMLSRAFLKPYLSDDTIKTEQKS